MDLDLLLQLVKNGIVLGLLYGLFAYGLSLIMAATGILHLAHGLALVATAYSFWWLFAVAGLGAVVATVLSLAVGGVVGAGVELLVYRPLRRAGAGHMTQLVASLSVLTLGQSLLELGFGSDAKAIPPTAFLDWTVAVGPLVIRSWDLLVLAASVVVFVALYVLQTRTPIGLSFRAVGDNAVRAETLGIRIQRTYLWVFLVGSVVAAMPGVLLAVQTPTRPSMGFELLVMAVIALVIGGVGSMPGALLGGIVIGLVESVAAFRLPTEWAHLVLFALLFVFLVARPHGLTRATVRHA
jgi:branched-chain amino acid transport system permease protein